MRLYIGGCCQGKTNYVKDCWQQEHPQATARILNGADLSPEALEGCVPADILNHYHLLVRSGLEQGRDVLSDTRRLLENNPDLWVICDEVGMGIVPVDAFERRFRETVGRCCCLLAKEAQQVERILCGRGMRIK